MTFVAFFRMYAAIKAQRRDVFFQLFTILLVIFEVKMLIEYLSLLSLHYPLPPKTTELNAIKTKG